MLKNLNVKQKVTEMQKGNFRHINTTNTMEMFNSTIMKIVVTQKKAHQPSQEEEAPRSPKTAADAPVNNQSDAIFGSSVLINGVAM